MTIQLTLHFHPIQFNYIILIAFRALCSSFVLLLADKIELSLPHPQKIIKIKTEDREKLNLHTTTFLSKPNNINHKPMHAAEGDPSSPRSSSLGIICKRNHQLLLTHPKQVARSMDKLLIDASDHRINSAFVCRYTYWCDVIPSHINKRSQRTGH